MKASALAHHTMIVAMEKQEIGILERWQGDVEQHRPEIMDVILCAVEAAVRVDERANCAAHLQTLGEALMEKAEAISKAQPQFAPATPEERDSYCLGYDFTLAAKALRELDGIKRDDDPVFYAEETAQ